MKEIITVNAEKCVGCRACVRACPVKGANIVKSKTEGGFSVEVDPERCIVCGNCLNSCTHGARDYEDDTADFVKYISRIKNQPQNSAVLIVSPAIKSVYPDEWADILYWFEKREVTAIYDGSFGSDIFVWAQLKYLEKHGGHYISQNCAAAVNYIKMYRQDLLKSILPVKSPIACEAAYIRDFLRYDSAIAALVPCPAGISEFQDKKIVNYVMTFKKLKEYFDSNKIKLDRVSGTEKTYNNFAEKRGTFGNVCERTDGTKRYMQLFKDDITAVSSAGAHIYDQLDGFAALDDKQLPQVFIPVSCAGGCVSGEDGECELLFGHESVCNEFITEEMKKKKGGIFKAAADDKLFKLFDSGFKLDMFLHEHKSGKKWNENIFDEELDKVFNALNKTEDAERCYNCGGCGYKTCRGLAEAIYRETAVPECCIMMNVSNSGKGSGCDKESKERLENMAEQCRAYSDKLLENIYTLRDKIGVIGMESGEAGNLETSLAKLTETIAGYTGSLTVMNEEDISRLAAVFEKISDGLHHLETYLKDIYGSAESLIKVIEELTAMSEEMHVTAYDAEIEDKYE